MSKSAKATAATNRKHTTQTPSPRTKRSTYSITQRGIRSDTDLGEFFAAAISDIDAGRSDSAEMGQMTRLTSQILSLQGLRLKASIAAKKNYTRGFFLGR